MSFLLILVGFMEKVTKSANMGNFRVLHRGVGPRQGVAEREVWITSGTSRRNKATPR